MSVTESFLIYKFQIHSKIKLRGKLPGFLQNIFANSQYKFVNLHRIGKQITCNVKSEKVKIYLCLIINPVNQIK